MISSIGDHITPPPPPKKKKKSVIKVYSLNY